MKRSQQAKALGEVIGLFGSAAELARTIGVSPSQISRVKNGSRRLTAVMKSEIIDAIDRNWDDDSTWAHEVLQTGGKLALERDAAYERKLQQGE